MKTKALLAAGLLMAATAASSVAQTVYSVNAVGFVNLNFPPGFSLASNPLEGANNTVSILFPSVPNGTSVFKFDSALGQYTGTTFLFGNWGNPSFSLVPGEGFFFKNPSSTTITNTFVGNVKQGALVTPLSAGFTLVGSQVPQAGLVATDLRLPIGNAESVFKFDAATQQYTGATFLFGSWGGGGEPAITVGEGFFVKKNAPTSWSRDFTVNQQ